VLFQRSVGRYARISCRLSVIAIVARASSRAAGCRWIRIRSGMPGCMKLTVIVFELVVDPIAVVCISMVQRELLQWTVTNRSMFLASSLGND